jgi:hypothetical protein
MEPTSHAPTTNTHDDEHAAAVDDDERAAIARQHDSWASSRQFVGPWRR